MTRRPPRKRELSAEERRLWEQAMRETRTLKKRDRGEKRPSASQQTGQASSEAAPPASDTATPRNEPAPSARRPATGADTQSGTPTTTPLARREARRIVRNPEAIDARLDLHGMRQREAYPALKGFLRAAQARGFRLVLIVTGKGTARDSGADEDAGDWYAAPFYESPRGVLRRLVPEWLAKPEFHDVVASVSPAHQRHGGEGALYVRLRRPAQRMPPRGSSRD